MALTTHIFTVWLIDHKKTRVITEITRVDGQAQIVSAENLQLVEQHDLGLVLALPPGFEPRTQDFRDPRSNH